MFTGKFSGKMDTWNSSAVDREASRRRTRWGWVFLDQENSSMASSTSYPRSRMARTMPLWDRVKGSKVPGKNATGRGVSNRKPPRSSSCSVRNRYSRPSMAAR